jgi:hypothetical protein
MSRRKIFELFGSIVIEGVGANKEAITALGKDIRKVNKTLNKMGRDATKIGKTITKNLTVPAIAVSAAVVKLTNDTAKYADQLLDLQQVTGISTDNLQGLEKIASEAGVNFKGLTNTIAKFTSKIPEIEAGTGRASEAMHQLGVDTFDSGGNIRDMNDLFPEIVNALQDVENITERNALSQQIFGKSLQDISPVLSLSKERFNELYEGAENLTGFMSSDAIKAANDYRVNIEDLKREFTGIFRELSSTLIPLMQDKFIPMITDNVIPAIQGLINWVSNLLEWFGEHPIISDFVSTFVAALAVMGPLLLTFAKFLPLIKSAVALYKAITAAQVTLNVVMAANPIGLIVLAIGALIAAGVVLVKNWDKVKENFVSAWDFIKFHFMNIALTIIQNYNVVILKILEGVKKLAKFVPGIGAGVDFLTDKIKKSSEAIKAQQEALKARRAEQVAAQKLAKKEAEIAEAAAEATKKNTEATKKNTEEKKKSKTATLEEIKAAEDLAEKRKKFESEWSKKLAKQTETRQEALEREKTAALNEAEKLGADRQAILSYYAGEEEKLKRKTAQENLKISKQLEKEEAALMKDGLQKLKVVTAGKLAENEAEKQEALRIAEERELDTSNIVKLYAAREKRIIKEAALEEQAISKETADKRKNNVKSVFGTVSDIAGGINDIWAQNLENRTIEIEQEAEQKKLAVENSQLSEEEKAAAIAKIDEETAAKKKQIAKENAIREKAAALFGIAVNTSLAVVKALPNIPLSIIVGGLGLASAIAVAARPIPLEAGALIRSDPGKGVIAQVGEGKEDEIVLPMKTGAAELAKNLSSMLGTAPANVASKTKAVVNDINLHIGTLIADEFGLKELSRRLRKYGIAENQRVGI